MFIQSNPSVLKMGHAKLFWKNCLFLASLFTVARSSWDESCFYICACAHTVWSSRDAARGELTLSAERLSEVWCQQQTPRDQPCPLKGLPVDPAVTVNSCWFALCSDTSNRQCVYTQALTVNTALILRATVYSEQWPKKHGVFEDNLACWDSRTLGSIQTSKPPRLCL